MLARCNNPGATGYARYGGRGITVCERWSKFESFAEDMGPRPEKFTIERMDNDKGYSPENCRWASRKEQSRNLEKTLRIEVDGITYVCADLAENSHFQARAIYNRIRSGMSIEEAVNGKKRLHNHTLEWQSAAWNKKRDQTHCKRGHEFTEENVYHSQGRRVCRACSNAKGRAWRAKRDQAKLSNS